ncbi:response regulator transcription factor [Micrococcoides hystricis]|uniref:Response regulator transcription factor n=1 Tax=Micrococcoides hystricis TaxID=1572761 RepID=A0ABV6P8P2_9MICC
MSADTSTEPTQQLRLLLVDDHPVVRAGLTAMFAQHPGFVVADEAADGGAALASVDRHHALGEPFDVVLMDLQMPGGMDGVQATTQLRKKYPQLPVLILTTYDTDADISAALAAGAAGYLLKDASFTDLCDAVLAAVAGEKVLAPEVAARLNAQPDPDELSEREKQILGELEFGYTNKQIGAKLFISEATVKTHLAHIYRKLGAVNRAQAIAIGQRLGIISTR